MGAGGGSLRSGRDSADLYGSGWNEIRLRLRACARGSRGSFDSGDCLGRGRIGARFYRSVSRGARRRGARGLDFSLRYRKYRTTEERAACRRHSREMAMLIPSIDLMGGKIVQLVQGEKKALEFDDLDYWIERFSKYPLVQVIDLDSARGTGDNRQIVKQIVKRLNCQVGGGIRSLEAAREALQAGARRVVLGSVLLTGGEINAEYAATLASELGTSPLVFALDSRGGRVAIDGWREDTALTAFDMIRALEPFCDTFLYTHIDTEGLMGGIPLETVSAIRKATSRRLIVAGGITTQEEIDSLDALGMDAVVGMALYSGKILG